MFYDNVTVLISAYFRTLHDNKIGCQAFVCFIMYWRQSDNAIVWCAVPRGHLRSISHDASSPSLVIRLARTVSHGVSK